MNGNIMDLRKEILKLHKKLRVKGVTTRTNSLSLEFDYLLDISVGDRTIVRLFKTRYLSRDSYTLIDNNTKFSESFGLAETQNMIEEYHNIIENYSTLNVLKISQL